MAARIELPFLYHTRTILRLPKRALRSHSQFASSQAASNVPVEDGKPPLSPDEESFLKAKARSVSWSPIAPRLASKNAETTISSTITASERRAFETILRFAPKQTEPATSKRRSPYADAADTDIENILKIFTSSLRSVRSERDGSPPALTSDDDVARREAREEHPDEQSRSGLTEQYDTESTDQLGLYATGNRVEDRSAPIRTVVPTARGRTGVERPLAPSTPEVDFMSEPQEESDILEQSLAETAIPSHPFGELDQSIQAAVREHMHSISRALQEAAYSTTKRGDIAMWEVCESRIFSMATDLQSRPMQQLTSKEEMPRYGGLRKFTFSREKSDDPRQLIEAAERELRRSSPSSGTHTTDTSATENLSSAGYNTISLSTLSTTQLAILQHTYPASLLLALRLYINLYPSSPYALLLLPRIRSLGTTSYVLGASPQFYNSLMSLVWLTRSSLREVDGLLAEMERGGVEMDEGTYAVLGGIEEERAMDLGREKAKDNEKGDDPLGRRGAAWWRRQEQTLWFPRILDWLDVVAGRLAAKERLV
ncbi:uncharacterized protein PV07_07568 [Cladophialophora immunda]|uniref:Mtf2-like C-terminal domain-containing protein n=1 Tax=Cladophialophora immunda TaxID=569365 RepID=A0A0D2CW34_9EURO|nr:uncharacterized protein PV07_07568 [Cladophialophora immunda]KIW27869.1 hypothetical protein PV07_07568 [Cladophialophora immunda]OQV01046.1 hypothetical protein CLAIMM_06463 [Cladophialophora immunda]